MLGRATTADLPSLARVLADAFAAYPWTRWSIPTEGYDARLEELQLLYLGHAHDHGLVFTDSSLRAVSAFLPPQAPQPSAALQERVAELHGDRLAQVYAVALPSAPAGAWTLATVGVSPLHQGRGLGVAVTRAGLETIDEYRAPVALETSSEGNVRLYRRLGFAVDAVTQIPDGPVVYSMSRAAGAEPSDNA
ncbi:hypothetical protein SD72_08495 [Leucobacter komagatae]|uniref:N-acetyltransferase domain-containing protein n=1 Tax=Leucobacter komagatae TaxID=55969 RepID=A0A0D0IM01_9MICO|nr:hypothetical protein SD72_08495 [Leucobacter komagatae]